MKNHLKSAGFLFAFLFCHCQLQAQISMESPRFENSEITDKEPKEQISLSSVHLYPALVTNETLYAESTTKGVFSIMSESGEIVQRQAIETGTNAIQLKAFPQGVYIVKVADDHGRILKKIKLSVVKN